MARRSSTPPDTDSDTGTRFSIMAEDNILDNYFLHKPTRGRPPCYGDTRHCYERVEGWGLQHE
jgi:hypothetical protein